MAELDDSHRWGEKTTDGVTFPICLDCKAEGYEDEPDGFLPCPGKAKVEPRPDDCGATMESNDVPGHIHRCGVAHTTGDHHCRECQRRFWST